MASLGQTERAPELKEKKSLPVLWSFSVWMMGLLVVSFILQQIIIVHLGKPYDAYIGLSWYGMKSGHLWELLSYQLLNQGWVNFLINVAGLWFAGRWLEGQLGGKRFILFYQMTIVLAGALQNSVQLAGLLVPESKDTLADWLMNRTGGQVGSSVGLCAIWVAMCLLKREDGTRLFGKFGWLVFGCTVIAGILMLVLQKFPELAHVAQLGALIIAMVFVLRINRKRAGRGGSQQSLHAPHQ